LIVTISAPTTGVFAGVPALFTIATTGLSTGAAVSSVTIDFGDGTGSVTLSGNVTSVPHTYAVAGIYAISVIATDTTGATGSGSLGVIVQARQPLGVSVAAAKDTPNSSTITTVYNVTAT